MGNLLPPIQNAVAEIERKTRHTSLNIPSSDDWTATAFPVLRKFFTTMLKSPTAPTINSLRIGGSASSAPHPLMHFPSNHSSRLCLMHSLQAGVTPFHSSPEMTWKRLGPQSCCNKQSASRGALGVTHDSPIPSYGHRLSTRRSGYYWPWTLSPT
jgi:hypothetical protein